MKSPQTWSLDDAEPSARLREQGFVLLGPARLAQLVAVEPAALAALDAHWSNLPPDAHMLDNGRYRYRRHASLRLTLAGDRIAAIVDRPHWQPTDYNALHGGIERRFAPMLDATLADGDFRRLLHGLARWLFETLGQPLPFVEAHQFRIDTANGIGRPTPEGAHRDGVDIVVVMLLARVDVRGGETRIFEADGPTGLRFTMREPGTCLVLDDARMIHETTPLQADGAAGYRDTLVLTFRRNGFLDPGSA
jgi:hypothetical protein